MRVFIETCLVLICIIAALQSSNAGYLDHYVAPQQLFVYEPVVQVVHHEVPVVRVSIPVPAISKSVRYYVPPPTLPPPTTKAPPTDEEYFKDVKKLVNVAQVALTDISDIAVKDNPDVGGKFALKIQESSKRIDAIFWEYKKSLKEKRRRRKRDAQADAENAKNKVGEEMIKASENSDKEKLSPEAQAKIDARVEKALDNCNAEVCKSHSEKLKRLKAAKAKKAG